MKNAIGLAMILEGEYRRYWETRFPGTVIVTANTPDGDIRVLVAGRGRVEEIILDAAWLTEAMQSSTQFTEKMRELDARVYQFATEMSTPESIAREIPVIGRTIRSYGPQET